MVSTHYRTDRPLERLVQSAAGSDATTLRRESHLKCAAAILVVSLSSCGQSHTDLTGKWVTGPLPAEGFSPAGHIDRMTISKESIDWTSGTPPENHTFAIKFESDHVFAIETGMGTPRGIYEDDGTIKVTGLGTDPDEVFHRSS